MNRSEIRKKLEKQLNKKRFEHSLGVEYVSGCLAMIHGADVEKALMAGLLHDCAKCLSGEEKISKCIKYGIHISKCEKNNPELLHAKLGACYAKIKYEVNDPEILTAIKYHTTGRPAMTLMEKIIFVADYIEPNRRVLPEIELIRREAFADLDKAVVHILRNTLSYLDNTDTETDETSLKTYNYYVRRDKLNE
jgi:predicted HD superfamily hydrolase involved in NAD metabolism